MASMHLYPPILDSSMPVFNKNDACNIYYSLSKFNSVEDIKSIQISVIYQKIFIFLLKQFCFISPSVVE